MRTNRRTFIASCAAAVVSQSVLSQPSRAQTRVELLLRQLDWILRRQRPQYYSILDPSVTEDRFAEFEKVLPAKLHEDFKALYRWKGGESGKVVEVIQGNRSFMSFDEVVDRKKFLDGYIGKDFENPNDWWRGWVPFLHNGGGSHLCIDLLAESGGTPGQLIAYWSKDKDRPIEYPSLAHWLAKLIDQMEKGTWK